MKNLKALFLLIFSLFMVTTIWSQNPKATVKEETRSIKTYPFDDPNPIPVGQTGMRKVI